MFGSLIIMIGFVFSIRCYPAYVRILPITGICGETKTSTVRTEIKYALQPVFRSRNQSFLGWLWLRVCKFI
jgi:hypothetical protein